MFEKLLAMMLAVMTVFSLSSVAFAHENVDNTFDHFTPKPGVEAPDNWYDPMLYDEEGFIKDAALLFGGDAGDNDGEVKTAIGALYCKKHKKVFEYLTCDKYVHKGLPLCPYCGECLSINDNGYSFYLKHESVRGVAYGYTCPDCGLYNIFLAPQRNCNSFSCQNCVNVFVPDKFYRYISYEQRDSEYAHIFEETAHKYGDGEDIYYKKMWITSTNFFPNHVIENPNQEKTFFEKVADFFASIADFFKRIFTGIFNF